MSKFYNVTGSTGITVELVKPTEDVDIKFMSLANIHATADATVSLFVQDDPTSGTTSTYKIISTVAIPSDTSLFLDDPAMFKFGESFGLYITVGSSDTVDVIIN